MRRGRRRVAATGRWLLRAVVAGAVTLGGASPAAAHSCAEPVTITAGVDTTVAVAVTVGDQPSGEIRFEFDRSFEIGDAVGRPGWTVEQLGSSVTFTGGPVEAEACEAFDIPVRATNAGTFRVRAFQTLEDGQVVEHPPNGDVLIDASGPSLVVNHEGTPNPAFEQVIYVQPGEEASNARSGLLLAASLGFVVIAVLVVRRLNRRQAEYR